MTALDCFGHLNFYHPVWQLDLFRLNVHHDGRIEYFERQKGVLVLQEGPDSPFYGLNLDNGLAEARPSWTDDSMASS